MTADQIATLNASGLARRLIDLTQRLTARLITELAAFEAHRPQEILVGMAEAQELANAYRRESAQARANPAALRAAPETDRASLIQATQAFESVLARHARAVEAARTISEGLVRTIAAELAAQRGSPIGYGAAGQASEGDGRAVALNRTA